MATRYNYTGNIVTQGLVLNLDAAKTDSYPGTGTTWYDISGNNNNGTLTNGPTFSGIGKQAAIVFDGADDYVNLGNFFTYQSFTINLWVKPGSSQVQYADIIDNNHLGNRNWVLQQNSVYLNEYEFAVIGSSGNFSTTGLFTLTSNMWVNLTFTYDGDKVRGYNNGTLFGTGASLGSSINYSSQIFSIGRWGNGGRNWNGQCSIVSCYNRPLTGIEIQQNYNATKGRYGI